MNQDDGKPLMSCGKCGRWQHINCHNAKDRAEGRHPRNWEVVDFTCLRCLKNTKVPAPASMATEQMSRPKKTNGKPPQQRQPIPQAANPVIPAASRKLVQGSEPSANGFAGFTHYHPQQQGFSINPAAAQAQVQAQSRSEPQRPPASINDWPAASSYAQFYTHNQNGVYTNPHVPYGSSQQGHRPVHPVPPPNQQPLPASVPTQTGPHYPHQIFNSQPAYNNHTPYRPQA